MALFDFVGAESVVKGTHEKLSERLKPLHGPSRRLGKGVEIAQIVGRERIFGEPEFMLEPLGGGMLRIKAARRALG